MIVLKHRNIYRAAALGIVILAVICLVFCIKAEQKKSNNYPENDTGITLCINEALYANLGFYRDCDGDNSDWIEIYNYGEKPVSLNGLSLTDHVGKSGRWYFPDITLDSDEYLIVWASGKNMIAENGELHADFFLSPSDTIIDEFYFSGSVDTGVSVGRLVKNPASLALLSANTPGSANNAKEISGMSKYDSSLPAPSFSKEAGVYESEFELSISAPEGTTILYTLDGSDPTLESRIYTEPILIKDRSDEPNTIGNIKTTPNYEMYYSWENTNTYKGTVVKARTMKDGAISDKVVTRSYFIAPDTSFAIVSLSVDADDLFDSNDGLYVPGMTYYVWKKYNKESTNNVFPPANYDSDEKVLAHVEIFGKNGEIVADNNVEAGIMGAASRSSAAKALKLTLYDNKASFDREIFELFPVAEEANSDGLWQIVVRPSGTDFNRSMFCDILAQNIVADELKVTTQAAEPAVLFINGEYWGIHNIREVYDEDYFYRHYGIDEKNLSLIKLNTGVEPFIPEISCGTEADLADYLELVDFAENHDLSISENYEYVCERIDIDSFIDYYIAEMYYGNDDWPGNNFRIWKADQPSAEYGDNKWRPVLFDIDDAFMYPEFNTIEYVLTKDYDKKILEGVNLHFDDNREIIEALIENESFRDKFFDRFEELLDTVFASENVLSYIDEFAALYEPEMESHFSRWHTTDGWLKKVKNLIKFTYSEKDLYTYEKWLTKIEAMRTFAKERPENLREYIRQFSK